MYKVDSPLIPVLTHLLFYDMEKYHQIQLNGTQGLTMRIDWLRLIVNGGTNFVHVSGCEQRPSFGLQNSSDPTFHYKSYSFVADFWVSVASKTITNTTMTKTKFLKLQRSILFNSNSQCLIGKCYRKTHTESNPVLHMAEILYKDIFLKMEGNIWRWWGSDK